MTLFETFREALANTRMRGAALLPLRLVIGYGFLAHGLAKVHKGADAFAILLYATGVPMPRFMAWLTISTEIATGVAMLLGVLVAFVSVPMIVLLLVAIFTVHLPYGFTSIKLVGIVNGHAQFGPVGYEYNLLYIAGIVALALSGSTPLSIDRMLLRDRRAV